MIRLTKMHILLLHEQLIKESDSTPEIRDEGLLDSGTSGKRVTYILEEIVKNRNERVYKRKNP